MKRRIILLIIILLIASVSISQTLNDTVCLPIKELRTAINKIEACKVVSQELKLTQKLLSNSNKLIGIKDSIITNYKQREILNKLLINNYAQTAQNDSATIAYLNEIIRKQKKISRRRAVSKWIIGILGVTFGILISK